MGIARKQRRASRKTKTINGIRQLVKAANAGQIVNQTPTRLRTRRYRRGLRGHETEGFAE